MKIMQLRYFVEVCKFQNVTRAAKEMFVSQPSVTSAIQELEKEFGVNLFYRQNKRMIVTKEGEYLFEQAKDILTRVDETTRAMKNFGGINNSIKIGIPPMIGSFLFPRFFHDFSKTNPNIQFEIQEFGTLQTRQMIEEDRLDAAFVILDEIEDEAFHILPILDTSLVFSCSKHSPLAKKEVVTVDDLKEEPLILMSEGSFQNAEIHRRFKVAGFKPNVVLRTSQIYLIKRFAEYNNAGSFLFKEIADDDPDLVGIPCEPPIPIRIGLIWKKAKYIYNGTTSFIEFARTYRFGK